MTAVLKGKQTRITLFRKTGKETDLRAEVSWILRSRMTEPEPRPQWQRHPPSLLTYNTLGSPTYETQAATHLISANSVLGRQLPQCCTAHLTWCARLPAMSQFQLPTYPYLSPHPVIFGYLGTYLQYPSMPPHVSQPVNQYPVHQSVVYQPRNDLMQVPVTMTPGYVPVPSCVS